MRKPATLTDRIAAFALELTLADVPPAEVHRATRLLADTLACGVAARGHELVETLMAYARRRSSAERSTATLLTGPGRADVALAALANVSAVRMLDANDIYCPPPGDDRGHFSDAIPALLAAAEVAGRTGADLRTAIVAVYEIQALLCAAAPWNPGGWHTASLAAWSIPAPVVRLWHGSLGQAITATSLAGRLGDGGARQLLAACDALPDAPDLTNLFAALAPAESPSQFGRF